jgi:cobyrinic acid a,c-diamide synthase
VAPLVAGFAGFSPDVTIGGIILNRVGSERHETMLRRALEPLGIPVLGAIHRSDALARPSRHLGLVQAGEHADLELFLNVAADQIAASIDLEALMALAKPTTTNAQNRNEALHRVPPPAQNIAVASDQAFAFSYPHILRDWREMGAQIRFFSPLKNEAAPAADLIYLPGGYPELHAHTLSQADVFANSMRSAAQKNVHIYGECGGYMTLGEGLIDGAGNRHKMLGLLPLETSFANRKLHLGYRNLKANSATLKGVFKGHEFHYATTLRADAPPLFEATDAEDTPLAPMGQVLGNISGSFAHIIDKA